MPKRPYPLRTLKKKLKEYGVEEFPSGRGKGSEIILIKPEKPGGRKGPQIPVKNHGPNTEIRVPVILSILRRFEIDPDEFWD